MMKNSVFQIIKIITSGYEKIATRSSKMSKLLCNNIIELKQLVEEKVYNEAIDLFAVNINFDENSTLDEFATYIRSLSYVNMCADKETCLLGLKSDDEINSFYARNIEDIYKMTSTVISAFALDVFIDMINRPLKDTTPVWDNTDPFVIHVNNKRLLINFVLASSIFEIVFNIDKLINSLDELCVVEAQDER